MGQSTIKKTTKIERIIDQIDNSIEDVEKELNHEEFKDYCDHAYSCIAYWRQIQKEVKEKDC